MPTKLDNACPAAKFPAGCVVDGQTERNACVGTANGVLDGIKIGGADCSTAYTDAELAQMPHGTYFAVNVGLEYPDRIEAENHARVNGYNTPPDSCFEYPATTQVLLSWDSSVLQGITTAGCTDGSACNVDSPTGTYIDVTPSYYQFTGTWSANGDGAYTNYMDTDHGWLGTKVTDIGANYFYIIRSFAAGQDMVFATAATSGCRASVANSTAKKWVIGQPQDGMGWFGLAHFGAGATSCTLTNDGVDSDVDRWFTMHYMRVIGASGSGSMLRIEPNNAHTFVRWNHSNCTRAGGTGVLASDDDIKVGAWCYPCDNYPAGNGLCNSTANNGWDLGHSCTTAYGTPQDDPKFYIYGGEEMPGGVGANSDLPGGPGTYRGGSGGGGYQAWNRHICVQ